MDANSTWAIANVVVPLVATIGFTVAGMTPGSFRAARVCFWVSAAWLIVSTLIWTAYADLQSNWRFVIATGVCTLAVVGLMVCLRWVSLREAIVQDVQSDAMIRKPSVLADHLRQLSSDILQFIVARAGAHPSNETLQEFIDRDHTNALDAIALGPNHRSQKRREHRERQSAARAYETETVRLYSQMFAPRVIEARDGIRLHENIGAYIHPGSTLEMHAVADWLVTVAERLSMVPGVKSLPEGPAVLDVRLEGTFPGTFALRAYGYACEIRTGPIVVEAAMLYTEKDGERAINTWSQRCLLQFPVISDLRNGEKGVEPSLVYDEDGRHHRWPDPGIDAAMKQFISAAQTVRRYRTAQLVLGREDFNPQFSGLGIADLEAIGARMLTPFEFGFEITYWNSDRTQQWRRSECLVYEPTTGEAFVRHPGEPRPIED